MTITDVFSPTLFKGKTVAVTGGGSGINLGIAKTFASLGANIAICGRTQEKLDAARAEIEALGAKVVANSADVRDLAAVEAFLSGTVEALGPCDVVVAGAAGNFLCAAEAMSSNAFKTVVDINLIGSFHAAKAAHAQLAETSGSIIFISAAQAFMPFEFQAHAGAAKAGVDQLMRQLALEWGRANIRANCIVPGPVEGTKGVASLLANPSLKTQLLDTIPAGRFGTFEDIGAAAAYLASPLASYVTGTTLIADGGQYLNGTGVLNTATRALLAPA
ncbi:SDR family oxidoreductase [Sphingorhabdus sp. Alg231-15]|uniref:SDR family oxidoreductase n=1 Tax=Sphingorhabdus sp. Alg231-15 TaxID=1922222 RepID=UPI000D55362B